MRWLSCLLLVFAATAPAVHAQALEDIVRWTQSDVWQVRYCAAGEFKVATPEARPHLERLSVDKNRAVARQSFVIYTNLFVDVDLAVAKQAFERGDFDLVGGRVTDRGVFTTPAFWLAELNRADDDHIAGRAIRALGLLGDAQAIPALNERIDSRNPYVLLELAKAFRRLGQDEPYLAALEHIQALPARENLHYHTAAIDCLLQTHPDRAPAAWTQVDQSVHGRDDIQPNWMYGHVRQGERLPGK